MSRDIELSMTLIVFDLLNLQCIDCGDKINSELSCKTTGLLTIDVQCIIKVMKCVFILVLTTDLLYYIM